MSPPSRRRGLKYKLNTQRCSYSLGRLLRGGVDWNQISDAYHSRLCQSPPSRRRGLKYSCENIGMQAVKASPPSRRRGLKSPVISLTSVRVYGRLLRGGVDWNLFWNVDHVHEFPSPPSRRRGLKFLCIFNRSNIKMSPPSRRRGLKFLSQDRGGYVSRRLLRGGVDWNHLCFVLGITFSSVASLGIDRVLCFSWLGAGRQYLNNMLGCVPARLRILRPLRWEMNCTR